jgi:CRISPR/Cas system-associated endonuclease Cas1
MQTVSIRLPDEDFHWLLSTQEAAGKTPSEKLRALVTRVHQQATGLTDPEVCAEWARGLVQPLANAVAAWERGHREHSDILSAALDVVPQLLVILVSARLGAEEGKGDELREIEAALSQQCFRLFATLLRAAVTSAPAVYEQDAIERYLPDIVEITNIIATRREKERKNG